MKLTIGMATYDDFDGVYFTIQALRLYIFAAEAPAELIVVDNNPTSRQGKRTRALLQAIGGRYVALPMPVGTAPPRQRVFEEASGDVVMCVDPHILLAPHAVETLTRFFEENPDSRDIVSGPLVYDSLTNTADLFMDLWREGMRGVWSSAWRCRCGAGYCTLNTPQGVAVCDILAPHKSHRACHRCGLSFPAVPWAGHESALERAGLSPIRSEPSHAPPIEIPGQGLGVFAMRKAAWPGFHPQFRGFGGEELYIHEKVRRAGGRALCLPGLRWVHRMSDQVAGQPYPNLTWQRVRNYILGHRELGLDIEPIRNHFVHQHPRGGFTQEMWDQLLANDLPEMPPGSKGCGTCGSVPESMTLEKWYETAAGKTSDINEHVPTLRELASTCDHVTEFGVRGGISTVALLAGQPKRLISYDVNPSAVAEQLKQRQGVCQFEFRQGDTRSVAIEPTDMLFIDTTHTAAHVTAELNNAAAKVAKYLVFHDTEAPWGERGEDGGPGVMPAVRAFLMRNPEWTVRNHYRNNHGLTVLSRLPEDRKSLPSTIKQAWNMVKAQTRHALNGGRYLPLPLAEQRQAECAVCEFRVGEQCSMCGCYLRQIADNAPLKAGQPGKTFYPTEGCPIGRWHPRPNDGVEMTDEQVAEMLR